MRISLGSGFNSTYVINVDGLELGTVWIDYLGKKKNCNEYHGWSGVGFVWSFGSTFNTQYSNNAENLLYLANKKKNSKLCFSDVPEYSSRINTHLT